MTPRSPATSRGLPAPRSLVVLWRVTERCDLACAFCAYDRSLRLVRRVADRDRVLAFAEKLGAHGNNTGTRVLVSWLGGEPLSWPPLADVSRACREQHGIDLSLTTNGTRLGRPEVRDLLLTQYAELTVSVDGFAEHHDRLRGRAGLYESLSRAVRALAAEKRSGGSGPLLRANVVLMRDTLAAFPALCRELARWGIEEITFNQLGGNDRPAFYPANRLLPEQVARFANDLPALRRELLCAGVMLRGADQYLKRIAASANGVPLAPGDCAGGRNFLFIDEEGRIAPCAFTAREYGIALDRIDDVNQSHTVDGLPAHFAAHRLATPARACADCHSTQHHGKFATS